MNKIRIRKVRMKSILPLANLKQTYLKEGNFNINDIHLLLVEIEIPPTQGEEQDCPLFRTSLLEILFFETQYKFKKYMYYHFNDFVTKVKKYIKSKSLQGEGQGEEDKAKKAKEAQNK